MEAEPAGKAASISQRQERGAPVRAPLSNSSPSARVQSPGWRFSLLQPACFPHRPSWPIGSPYSLSAGAAPGRGEGPVARPPCPAPRRSAARPQPSEGGRPQAPLGWAGQLGGWGSAGSGPAPDAAGSRAPSAERRGRGGGAPAGRPGRRVPGGLLRTGRSQSSAGTLPAMAPAAGWPRTAARLRSRRGPRRPESSAPPLCSFVPSVRGCLNWCH